MPEFVSDTGPRLAELAMFLALAAAVFLGLKDWLVRFKSTRPRDPETHHTAPPLPH
jgi:hypothetical protein